MTTAKFDAFKADLVALCAKHGVELMLTTDETLAVWDKEGSQIEYWPSMLQDCTKEPALPSIGASALF